MAGVDVLRMFGETRSRTPLCSSPLEDTVRSRCRRGLLGKRNYEFRSRAGLGRKGEIIN